MKKKREEEEERQVQKKVYEEFQANLKSNKELQTQTDYDLDMQDAVRKSIVQEVIDEAREAGNPLPPKVLKLLNHFKGKFEKKCP